LQKEDKKLNQIVIGKAKKAFKFLKKKTSYFTAKGMQGNEEVR